MAANYAMKHLSSVAARIIIEAKVRESRGIYLCEHCSRQLRPDEGKVCHSCAKVIQTAIPESWA